MVLVWIGIGIGILLAVILFFKITKPSSHERFSVNLYCNRCGAKTNGLKCPICEKESTSYRKWR